MNTNDNLQEIIRIAKAYEFAIQIYSFDRGLLRQELLRILKDALKGTSVGDATSTIGNRLVPEKYEDFSVDRVIHAVESWIEEGRPPRQFRGDKLINDLAI
jgi:hypothetical protein